MSILKDSRDFLVCEMQIRRMQISSGYIRFRQDISSTFHATCQIRKQFSSYKNKIRNSTESMPKSTHYYENSFPLEKKVARKFLKCFFMLINTNTNRNSIPETGTESINQHEERLVAHNFKNPPRREEF